MPYETGIVRRVLTQYVMAWACITLLRIGNYLVYAILFDIILPFRLLAAGAVIDFLFVMIINLGFMGAYFIEQYKLSNIREEALRREHTEVRFHNLKNQLNPHFLFNSLTSLNSLIFIDQKMASKFLQQLSRVYRYVLSHKEDELVPLQEEIQFVKNYVHLLETRFDGAFEVKFEIDPRSLGWGIVPVTLQVLIENAVKHNTMSKDEPLKISIFTSAEGQLTVSNNLQRRPMVHTSNKIGLENMRSLYQYFSNKPINIFEVNNSFNVCLPLLPLLAPVEVRPAETPAMTKKQYIKAAVPDAAI